MLVSEEYINFVEETYNKNYTVEMAACALIEEFQEFGESQTTDEFGDILYQLTLFGILLNIPFDSMLICDADAMLYTYITKITSQYKKHITRGKELDKELIIKYYSNICSLVMKLAKYYDYDIKSIEQENIKKLNERYSK